MPPAGTAPARPAGSTRHNPVLALLAAGGAQAFVGPDGPLRIRARPRLAAAVCLTFVLVILLEGSAFRRTDGALAGPTHMTVPPPPPGLRHAQAPLIHLPADDAFTSADDLFTYRYMIWSTEGFPGARERHTA